MRVAGLLSLYLHEEEKKHQEKQQTKKLLFGYTAAAARRTTTDEHQNTLRSQALRSASGCSGTRLVPCVLWVSLSVPATKTKLN